MQTDTKNHFNLIRDFRHAGYFETEHLKKITSGIISAIKEGKLIAISGIVGSGKTTVLQRIQDKLKTEEDFIVSKSYSIEKHRVTLSTLVTALFLDLSNKKIGDINVKIPSNHEKSTRKLISIIQDRGKNTVLFVDEAHDLHGQTLIGLKRLMESINNVKPKSKKLKLSVVLAGHPKLKNDLVRPNLEEIGSRSEIFTLDGITSSKREYIEWLLTTCSQKDTGIDTILTADALDFLAERLITPLQIEHYLTLALEEAYLVGIKPVSTEIVEAVIAKDINDPEPTLTRQGYNVKNLANVLNVKPIVIRSFLKGKLPQAVSQEIQAEMLAIGIHV